ncbi:FecR domain-containing protein [Paucibacter sp. R3-3]|uniref:FecR domain-containing protein n=1 Tax=Roseateles agri TaxID=3098619 RepID=A0ABU5DAS1_9BURK|nr:FecR domain-containing protein [Paucibacter sp. R3-3]MDY0743376.1 FecR domain-containing protein [Paucibacter sp. R3-3]
MKNEELKAIEARAADWIAERDRSDGHLPAERQAELQRWLAESTAHRVAFLRLDQTWQRADRLRALKPAKAPEAASRPTRIGGWHWMVQPTLKRAAAGLSLAVLTLIIASAFRPQQRQDTVNYATARGQRQSIKLADGSQLTLNTATQLRTAVTPRARQVWLESGEAFFDIAHDAQRPFVIHAGKQTVTVLGTKFSLFREGDRLNVTVLEGRVQVQGEDQGQATVLTRDHAALADAGNVLVTLQSPQQVNASLGWLQGKLVFNEVSLAEAARQFNRYGIKQLVIKDEAAARIGIGGVFDAGNVEAFARLLHAGFGLEVRVSGDEIQVSTPTT